MSGLAFPKPQTPEESEGQAIMMKMVKKKMGWMDAVFKKHLPRQVYRWGHSPSKSSQARAAKHLAEHGWEIQEQGSITRILRNKELLGTHVFTFHDSN